MTRINSHQVVQYIDTSKQVVFVEDFTGEEVVWGINEAMGWADRLNQTANLFAPDDSFIVAGADGVYLDFAYRDFRAVYDAISYFMVQSTVDSLGL